jgi:hypothetical protein
MDAVANLACDVFWLGARTLTDRAGARCAGIKDYQRLHEQDRACEHRDPSKRFRNPADSRRTSVRRGHSDAGLPPFVPVYGQR